MEALTYTKEEIDKQLERNFELVRFLIHKAGYKSNSVEDEALFSEVVAVIHIYSDILRHITNRNA